MLLRRTVRRRFDAAGNRISRICVQRRPPPWAGLVSARRCGFPSDARITALTRSPAQHVSGHFVRGEV